MLLVFAGCSKSKNEEQYAAVEQHRAQQQQQEAQAATTSSPATANASQANKLELLVNLPQRTIQAHPPKTIGQTFAVQTAMGVTMKWRCLRIGQRRGYLSFGKNRWYWLRVILCG
jgi:hypothetical protein